MKIQAIYSDKDGILKACVEPVPKLPSRIDYAFQVNYDAEIRSYREALQKVKDSAVPFEDELLAATFVNIGKVTAFIPVPDTFYPCEVEVEIIGLALPPVARLSPVAPQPSLKEKPDVIKFLLGEGELDGVWFGDKPVGKMRFWWRAELRVYIESLQKELSLKDDELRLLRMEVAQSRPNPFEATPNIAGPDDDFSYGKK